jgi:Peptidase propeptide and YPEB domain
MQVNRKFIAIAAAIAALAAGGVGIAYAVGGGDDEQVTGPDAEKAKSAALKAVGGGSVTEVERQDGDGAGVFEVEVKRDDGSQVEVHIDGRYQPVGTAADDDRGSDSDDDDAGEGSDDD